MKKRFKEIYTRFHLETGAERKDLEEDERANFGGEEKLPSTDQHGNEASNEADVLLASWTADVVNFCLVIGLFEQRFQSFRRTSSATSTDWQACCGVLMEGLVVFSLSFITSLLTAITGRHPLFVALVSFSSYILLKK
ncbi:hypothetical protein T01_1578 [Trichinella spiralis]|uniref:Uncharacterized protein n=1 Tax=Trichinella spiralis TaxID=6334 RepID=A0A0V1BNN9_TRISP|nr:hypothetical protein T01_1578 [Trichinella spiralis]